MWEEEPGITLMPAGAEFPLHHCHRVPAFPICITRISHVFLCALPSKFAHIFLHAAHTAPSSGPEAAFI